MGAAMKRLNAGCGSVQPPDWENADLRDAYISVDFAHPDTLYGKIAGRFATTPAFPEREPIIMEERYDYIVANHLLSCFSHHELIEKVLPNLRSMLKPGGVLRVLVPDVSKAVAAYINDDTSWFPLGDDLPDVSQRFCTFLPWFGESKSIFDSWYLHDVGMKGGFGERDGGVGPSWGSWVCEFGQSHMLPDSEIAALDSPDRARQSLIMEFRR